MATITKNDIKNVNEIFKGENIDKMLASALLTQPALSSQTRVQMYSSHITQSVLLNKPDVPKIFTGYEKEVGKYADSFYKADCDFEIVAKISRFTQCPDMIYLLVVKKRFTNNYDVIKVSHYEKKSDNHGFMRPFTYIDDKRAGDIIHKDETVFRATSLDESGNYRYGVNAKVAFISSPDNEEDAQICSESFAKKTTFNLVEKTEYTINKNDIMLNIYGDHNEYKFMPNVGEHVNEKLGILFASRKIDKKNIMSDLTDTALTKLYYNDNKFLGKGYIVDIDIKVNDVSELETDEHREQLFQMYNDQFRYNQEIYNCLNAIVKNTDNKVSNMLKQELFNATNYINPNVNYSSNSSKFEFAYITVYTSYETSLHQAYKLTNRFGGKGVIGAIWPDEYMPVDQHGTRADLVISTPSIVARANIGQSYEHEFNYCSDCIVRNMKKMKTTDERIKYLLEYITTTNKEYGEHIRGTIKMMNAEQKREFIDDIFLNGIHLYSPPFHNTLGFDILRTVKKKFKIKPSYIRMRREYNVGKEIADLYQPEQTFNAVQSLNDDYIWTTDHEKIDTSFGIEDLLNVKNTKNSAKLPLDEYKKNEWVDDFIWDNKTTVSIETESKDDELNNYTKNMNLLSEVVNFEDDSIREIKKFNSLETRVFRKENDPNTIIREYRSKRPVIIADIYYMVLKHIPDNGFSARYLGNTTPLGIPNKAHNKAESGRPYSNTCNKMSDMDNCNLKRRCDPEIVSRFMATSSTNPEYRSMVAEQLLFDDPLRLHNIPIANNEIKDTVPAKIFRAYGASLGFCYYYDHEKDDFNAFDDIKYDSLEKLLHIPPASRARKEK